MKLDLSNVYISAPVASGLFRGILKNTSITDLILQGCFVGSTLGSFFGGLQENQEENEMTFALGKLIAGNSTLANLNISNCQTNSLPILQAVVTGMKNNTTLTSLDFGYSRKSYSSKRQISDLVCQLLSPTVPASNALATLRLTSCELDNVDIGNIANALRQNASLTMLDLGHNNFTDFFSLARVLAVSL